MWNNLSTKICVVITLIFVSNFSQANNNFEKKYGIGIVLEKQKNGWIFVSSINNSGPAYNAGIEVDDYIISINNVEIKNKDLDLITKMIPNKSGLGLDIVVYRPDTEKKTKHRVVVNEYYSPMNPDDFFHQVHFEKKVRNLNNKWTKTLNTDPVGNDYAKNERLKTLQVSMERLLSDYESNPIKVNSWSCTVIYVMSFDNFVCRSNKINYDIYLANPDKNMMLNLSVGENIFWNGLIVGDNHNFQQMYRKDIFGLIQPLVTNATIKLTNSKNFSQRFYEDEDVENIKLDKALTPIDKKLDTAGESIKKMDKFMEDLILKAHPKSN